ncbi:MAG: phosphoribosylamine--glycine ligase, partial [bacterium]
MKLLVVGGGGREHALLWKFTKDNPQSERFSAPGNAGMAELSLCLPFKAEDIEGIADFAVKEKVDFTVVGPEAPLVGGIVDEFKKRNLKIFGPTS